MGNHSWWTTNPMTYDWHGTLASERLTPGWFDEMDARWIKASYPYLSRQRPFDVVMPDSLQGKRVLEIGCGMGLHTQHLAQRGARVTAIDLTVPAVDATRARMQETDYRVDVRQADAESLPFDAGLFDMVWSWGVIHHSSRTARIVREVARVLAADGEARLMVYNRDSRIARALLAHHYLTAWKVPRPSSDEVLWAHADGFTARHYTVDGFNDLVAGSFEEAETIVLGQEADCIPLPSRLRRHIAPRISDVTKVDLASRHGSFLFSIGRSPIDNR